MLRNMFKKTYTKLEPERKSPEEGRQPEIPEGLWRKCNKCRKPIYVDDVKQNFYVCPKCGGYFRVHAYRRIEMVIDEGTFEEWDKEMPFANPLNFPGYEKKTAAVKEKTNLSEAIVTGKGKINGLDTVIGVCDSRFFMSSMGSIVGEKITRAVERATEQKLPVILFACSGGARMQEGMVSLMQMAKTSAAIKKHHEAGLLYITYLTDPTTGGVTASFGMLGDVILAEPGALIGFAGPRVIEQTIRQKLPEGFQRAEFLLEHGFIDKIVERKDCKSTLAKILLLHNPEAAMAADAEKKAEASDRKENVAVMAEEVSGKRGKEEKSSRRKRRKDAEADSVGFEKTEEGKKPASAWDCVLLSRRNDRPTARDYIQSLFDEFMEFHGDRYFGDDGAIVGGVALFNGIPVTVIGQQKGRNTKENLKTNFGMPSPEGYRKALRLMRQAEKFGRPIICFVDTPGAFCGMEAEERGQGEAIARNLFEMSDMKVPILSVVIGEGGSGGALAMAMANEVWMLENSIYSILSPEGFASILWKDSTKAPDAAKVMKITAKDLKKLGIIEEIIPEEEPAVLENLETLTGIMSEKLTGFLDSMKTMSGEEIAEARYQRFRKIGA